MVTLKIAALLMVLALCLPHAVPAGDRIALQLAWKHQFQFAGYYTGLHKGFYREAGLEVTLVEGGDGRFAREEVLDGRAEYGIAGAELVLHRKDGAPFIVLAPIFQHSPSILLVRKDSGIGHLQDLVHKRVMLLPGKKDADILAALLNEGIDPKAFTRIDQTYNLDDLILGRVDAVSGYVTNEPYLLRQMGVDPSVISPLTYGVDFYSDCLFTTQSEALTRPERVAAFLAASLKGWEYAMDNPEEIADLIIKKYRPDESMDHLLYEASAIRKIMLPDLVEIGHMNPGRWKHIVNTYARLNMIDPNFSLQGFIYQPVLQGDYTRVRRLVTVTVAASLILGLGTLVLYRFNRKLKKEISERLRVEQALVRQKEKAERYFNLAPVMFLGLDRHGNVNIANDRACTLLGYRRDEIVGLNWFSNFIPEKIREKEREVFRTMMEGYAEPARYFENTVLSKNGGKIVVAWHNTYLINDSHGIAGALSSGEDITEKQGQDSV